jgi:hypothetical protein
VANSTRSLSNDAEDDPWLVAGFSEDDKKAWSQRFEPHQAYEWMYCYFDYDSAVEWCVNFTPEEAYRLQRHGLSVTSATEWKDRGFSVDDTIERVFAGYATPDEATHR